MTIFVLKRPVLVFVLSIASSNQLLVATILILVLENNFSLLISDQVKLEDYSAVSAVEHRGIQRFPWSLKQKHAFTKQTTVTDNVQIKLQERADEYDHIWELSRTLGLRWSSQ